MKKTTKKGLTIGAGIAAVATAAAGAYFLTSTKKGKKVSKKISAWAGKAEREVLSEVKKIKAVNQRAYNKAVDKVAKKYKSLKDIDNKDVSAFSKKIKGRWTGIKKEIEKKVKAKIIVKKKPAAKRKVVKKKAKK